MAININLLPWREELKDLQTKRFYLLLVVSALCSAAIVLSIHLVMLTQIDFQNSNNQFLQTEIQRLDSQIKEIDSLEKEKKKLLARMEIIQELQGNRPHIVRIFDAVVQSVPRGLYLDSLHRGDNRVVMSGKAESNTRVSTFMRNIEGSNWLSNPKLSMIQADQQNQDRFIEFNLEALEVKSKK